MPGQPNPSPDGDLKLTERERLWIVKMIARCERPKAIQTEWAKSFPGRIALKASLIEDHNFDNPVARADASARLNAAHGAKIMRKHVEKFDEWRKQWLEEIDREIPISRQAVRLRNLHEMEAECREMAEIARSSNPPNLGRAEQLIARAQSLNEQAAKETGGLYTNARDVTSGGQPFKVYVGFDPESQ